MTCKDVILQFLLDYVDRALSPEEEAEFNRHLAECPSCVSYLNTYRETIRLGREALSEEEDGAEIPERLVQAILSVRLQ